MATPRFRHVLSSCHSLLDAAAKSRPDAKPLKSPQDSALGVALNQLNIQFHHSSFGTSYFGTRISRKLPP